MKSSRVLYLALAVVLLAIVGCGSGGARGESEDSVVASDSTDATTRSVDFNGIRLSIPDLWDEKDISDTSSFGTTVYWGDAGGEGLYGGVCAMLVPNESFGNTSADIPEGANEEDVREAEDAVKALKALNSRAFIVSWAATCGLSVTEEECTLEELDGHALWKVGGKSDGTAYLFCSVPFDDHIVAMMLCSTGEITPEQNQALESLSCTEDSEGGILVKAIAIEGKASDDAIKDVVSDFNSGLDYKPTNSQVTSTSSGTSSANVTSGMRNAYETANDYLRLKAFSRSGLIRQLEHDGYTSEEAEYALSELERTGIDWNAIATRAAEEYLGLMSMSKEKLVRQLEHDGFTSSQAEYAADMVY